jgi:hypothetical protein
MRSFAQRDDSRIADRSFQRRHVGKPVAGFHRFEAYGVRCYPISYKLVVGCHGGGRPPK